MSKRNRNRNKPKPTTPPAPPAAASAQPVPVPAPKSGFLRGFDRSDVLASIAIVISVVVAVLGWVQFSENKKMQKEAQDRQNEALDMASGKIVAKMEFAAFGPLPSEFPEDHKIPSLDGNGKRPYFVNPGAMIVRAPTLFLNNTGDKPIDAIRVETAFLEGMIDSRGDPLNLKNPPPDWYKNDTPVLLRKKKVEEHILPQQWLPGLSLEVSTLKGALDQMVQAQSKTRTDKMHYARLSVMVSGRLSGSTIFGSEGLKATHMVAWMPKDFPEDECKRILEEYQPRLQIRQKIQKQGIHIYTGTEETDDMRMFNGPSYAENGKVKGK